jgi:hypothetical protein
VAVRAARADEGDMDEFLHTLQETWPAQLVADWPWWFPILEVTHLTGITVVFGGMVILDVRLLGVGRSWSVKALERYVLRFVWAGFAIALFSGGWLFLYEAVKLAGDPPFLIKMALIPLAGLNALFMHFVAMRNIEAWDANTPPPPLVRVSAGLSLAIWWVVLACGRMIAYYYPYTF